MSIWGRSRPRRSTPSAPGSASRARSGLPCPGSPKLRRCPSNEHTSVIFCTATYAEDEIRALATACGVSQILFKPCEPRDIYAAVDEALANGGPPDAPMAAEDFHEHLRVLNGMHTAAAHFGLRHGGLEIDIPHGRRIHSVNVALLKEIEKAQLRRPARPVQRQGRRPRERGAGRARCNRPGGALGRRLLTHVRDVMHAGDALPRVGARESLAQAILEISKKRLGMVAVMDDADTLLGVLTDGDLRRLFEKGVDPHQAKVFEVMSKTPISIIDSALAVEAAQLMEARGISKLPVVDHEGRCVGALQVNDLLSAKVI